MYIYIILYGFSMIRNYFKYDLFQTETCLPPLSKLRLLHVHNSKYKLDMKKQTGSLRPSARKRWGRMISDPIVVSSTEL